MQRLWGRYRHAQDAIRGGLVVESPRQRQIRRDIAGTRRGRADYLDWVRNWLDSDPTPTHTVRGEYDAWANTHNDRSAPATVRAPSAAAILGAMHGCTWEEVLAVAREQVSLDALEARDLDDFDAGRPNPLGLCSARAVAAVLDLRNSELHPRVTHGEAPQPVATLSGFLCWLKADIRAFRDDGRVIPRARDELQPRFRTTTQVADVLGMRVDSLIAGLCRDSGWVPPPDGYVGQGRYWLPDSPQRWLSQRRGAGTRPPNNN